MTKKKRMRIVANFMELVDKKCNEISKRYKRLPDTVVNRRKKNAELLALDKELAANW
jgi:hypothetical protein